MRTILRSRRKAKRETCKKAKKDTQNETTRDEKEAKEEREHKRKQEREIKLEYKDVRYREQVTGQTKHKKEQD